MQKSKIYIFKYLVVISFLFIYMWTNITLPTIYCKPKEMQSPYLFSALEENINKNSAKTVVLDAGHGGYDSGSLANGFIEKDVTLEITKKVGEALIERGYQVVYTRKDDDWYFDQVKEDLAQRVKVSEKAQASLFISFHLNDYADETRGIETWVSYDDAKAYSFANIVQQNLVALHYSEDRGIKNQDDLPLYVLNNNNTPAVLIELGFISSIIDIEQVTFEPTQMAISNAVADSVEQYMMM